MSHDAKVHQTWLLLRITYSLVPIVLGLDKFFAVGWIVNWTKYLSPIVSDALPLTVAQILLLIGVVEIIAGVFLWFYPRLGGYVVAAWLGLVIIDLASIGGYYDIIARDIVIAIGAIALSWLTERK